ncbi:hypothetical protein [Rhodospirillum sp. A1_3_36]|uniref:hypothetical protein n=1 Tax=Rhodospirillum sp. A1_3_36 TaxID=3391666 RepID=UPI0039A5D3F6
MRSSAIMLSVFLIVSNSMASPVAAQTVANCKVEDDGALYSSLQSITQPTLERVNQDFDYLGAVQQGWQNARMNDILAHEATTAAQRLTDEWGVVRTYLTGWGVRAEEAANIIADRVFRGAAFEQGISNVSQYAIGGLTKGIEAKQEILAGRLQDCLNGYLGNRYPQIVQNSLSKQIASKNPDLPIEGGSLPQKASVPMATVLGIILIVGRRVLAKVASRIAGTVGKRVVGKIVARFIPIIGWVLLAYEVAFASQGAIPAITQAMYDDKVVVGIQTEIATELRTNMNEHIGQIADEIVSNILNEWKEFQRAHVLILSKMETDPKFKRYMSTFNPDDDLTPIDLALSRVVSIGGETLLDELLSKRRVDEIIHLPDGGFQIAEQTGNFEVAFSWMRQWGGQIDVIAKSRLFKVRAPDDLSDAALRFLLGLGEPESIEKLGSLPPELIETFPAYRKEGVEKVAIMMERNEAAEFFAAMRQITDIQARTEIWSALESGEYSSDEILGSADSIAASRDQSKAAQIRFAPFTELLSPQTVLNFVAAVWDGSISWSVLKSRYGMIFFAIIGIMALILLLFLRGLLPSRTKVIIKHEKPTTDG